MVAYRLRIDANHHIHQSRIGLLRKPFIEAWVSNLLIEMPCSFEISVDESPLLRLNLTLKSVSYLVAFCTTVWVFCCVSSIGVRLIGSPNVYE